jgi:serine/threonine protein kinase
MPLSPGSHLGPYEVLALIGAGGMGEVYRARDPRLGREVAIKVLPHDRVADESRRQRFIQEAKTASSLNHSHIVTIHEFASVDGIDFLVMEYVRGKSLENAIPRHGLGLDETLRIAIAVADGLAAAHARGILHRDLKPANVAIGQDGAVKVLDFGLAKLRYDEPVGSAPEGMNHTTVAHTEPGRVWGTLAYMAPEQAASGTTDARSDIFSFGAVLYEMATGQRAFAGKSSEETLERVLQAAPTPPRTIVPTMPPDLQRVILRCLRKDPSRRFQTMADLKVDLLEIKETSDSGGTVRTAGERSNWRTPMWTAAPAVAALAVALAIYVFFARKPPSSDAPMRVTPLTTISGSESWPEFSPDGTQVAFTWDGGISGANNQVYITLVGGGGSRQITNDQRYSYTAPSWSPDGRQIAVSRCVPGGRCELRLISPLGGQDTKVNESTLDFKSAWSPDGKFLAAALAPTPPIRQGAAILLLPVAGGAVRRLTQPNASGFDFNPAFSRDGLSLAYVSCLDPNGLDCDVYLTALTPTLEVSGAPRRVTHNAGVVRGLAWTRDGTTLIYGSRTVVTTLYRVRIGAAGQSERVEVAGFGAGEPATSSVGDRLAFTRSFSNIDVYRLTAGRPPQPIVTSSFKDEQPAVSPDGQRFAFCTSRSTDAVEVWVTSADGSGARQLTHGPGSWQCSPRWSPDGKTIAFDSLGADGHRHIWTIDAEGATPTQLTTGPGNDQMVPTWSRDGAWVYYSASGCIWKTRISDRHAEQVTKEIVQGEAPAYAAESADGKELLYSVPGKTGQNPVVAMTLGGRALHQVVSCAFNDAFADSPRGFFYAACGEGGIRQVRVLDRRTGNDRVLLTLDTWDTGIMGLPVSPDGTSVYYPKDVSPHSADLMLIENFR